MARKEVLSESELNKKFEEFLEEPLSDESVDSEKIKQILQQDDSRPWWMSEDDQKKENTDFNKFLKSQKINTTSLDISDLLQSNSSISEKEKISTLSRTEILPTDKREVIMTASNLALDLEDTLSLTSGKSMEDITNKVLSPVIEENHVFGQNTLEEVAIKESFFKELEEQASSSIDYSELNRQIELNSSLEDVSQEPLNSSKKTDSSSTADYSEDFESDHAPEVLPKESSSKNNSSARSKDGTDSSSTSSTLEPSSPPNESNLKEAKENIVSDQSQNSFIENEKKILEEDNSFQLPQNYTESLINLPDDLKIQEETDKSENISKTALGDTLDSVSELKNLIMDIRKENCVSAEDKTDKFLDTVEKVEQTFQPGVTYTSQQAIVSDFKNKTFTINQGEIPSNWHQVDKILEIASELEKKMSSYTNEFDFDLERPLSIKSSKPKNNLLGEKTMQSLKHSKEISKQSPSKTKSIKNQELQLHTKEDTISKSLPVLGKKMELTFKLDDKNKKNKYKYVKSSGYGQTSKSENIIKIDPNEEKLSANDEKSLTYVKKNLTACEELIDNQNDINKTVSQKIQQQMHQFMDFLHGYANENKAVQQSQEESTSLSNNHLIKVLSQEIEEWKMKWQEERKLNSKLYGDVTNQEQIFGQQIQDLKKKHEQEIFQLQQKNFILAAKLPDKEHEKSPDHLVDDKQELMEKSLQEQEKLLHGYQKENEKLYHQLRLSQADSDCVQAKLLRENHHLENEVTSLKNQLEKKELEFHQRLILTDTSLNSNKGNEKIAELENNLENAKIKEQQLQDYVIDLKLYIEQLLQKKEIKDPPNIKEFSERHSQEVEDIKNQLGSYIENQELLNNKAEELHQKDILIDKVKKDLQLCQTELKLKTQEIQRRIKERINDDKRLQDFERQIKEMESIIRRRYPNSIPALIFAANADGKMSEKELVNFLEQQVKKLENELEAKDSDIKQRLKAMEQEFTLIKEKYEQQIQNLEFQLSISKNNKTKTECTSVSNCTADLQKELNNLEDKHVKEVSQFHKEIELLKKESGNYKEALKSLTLKLTNREQDLKVVQNSYNVLHKDNEHLTIEHNQLLQKFQDLKKAKDKPVAVKKTKEKFKTGFESVNKNEANEKKIADGDEITQLIEENKQLKIKLEELSLDIVQQRIILTAQTARVESELRKVQENHDEKIFHLNTLHQTELSSLRDQKKKNESFNIPEFKRRCDIQQIQLEHLKQELMKLQPFKDELILSKKRESVLETQIQHLLNDLKVTQKSQSPEMKQFSFMQHKIEQLEIRLLQKEIDLRHYNFSNSAKSFNGEKEIVELQQKLQDKTKLMERFQIELDSILYGLQELHQRGITVPLNFQDKNYVQ